MVRSLVYSCLWLTLLLIACTPTIAPSAPASNAVQPSLYRQGQSAVSGLYVQAQQRIQQRDYVGAEQLYQQAVAQEPGNPLAYVGIGACRVLTNDLDTAEQMYHKALELDPHLAMAYVGLGSVAAKREQFRDSMRWHARALAEDPDVTDAHYGVATAADALGEVDRALAEFELFLKLASPSSMTAYAQQRQAALRTQR